MAGAANQTQQNRNVGSAKEGKQEVFLVSRGAGRTGRARAGCAVRVMRRGRGVPPQGVKGNAQMLGMKGAQEVSSEEKWAIRVQLTKPVTWIPLIWVRKASPRRPQSLRTAPAATPSLRFRSYLQGVACGAAASGHYEWNPHDVAIAALTMLMSGPLLTGYTQTINDYYDREIDAINEPYRPIPSGKISEGEVVAQFLVLLAAGVGVASVLDWAQGHEFPTVTALAVFGSFISYIYSAPPLKLKQSGWIGNYALGSSYIALPWLAGQVTARAAWLPGWGQLAGQARVTLHMALVVPQSVFGTLSPDVMVLTVLYSIAGLGIAIVNDFKSIEGDRQMGLQARACLLLPSRAIWSPQHGRPATRRPHLPRVTSSSLLLFSQSLPVAFGVDTAKYICAASIDLTQLGVAAYLWKGLNEPVYAAVLLGLILPQIFFQFKASEEPQR